jgi:predicted DNA-binding transcriptional regulator AlpA
MDTIAPSKQLLNISDAASYLGITPRSLQQYHKTWDVPCFKVGRNLMFRESELEQWLQDHRQV